VILDRLREGAAERDAIVEGEIESHAGRRRNDVRGVTGNSNPFCDMSPRMNQPGRGGSESDPTGVRRQPLEADDGADHLLQVAPRDGVQAPSPGRARSPIQLACSRAGTPWAPLLREACVASATPATQATGLRDLVRCRYVAQMAQAVIVLSEALALFS
jgi:hypothetical protein